MSKSNDEAVAGELGCQVGPKGIWGWNTIPILNLVMIAGQCGLMMVQNHFPLFFDGTMWALWNPGHEAYNVSLGCMIVLEVAYNLFVATAAVYALVLVFRRSATYPKFTAKLFWFTAVCCILDYVAVSHFQIEITPKEIQQSVRGLVFALIWTAYFRKSVRIRNTFVNAPANLRKLFVAAAIVIALGALACGYGMFNCRTEVEAAVGSRQAAEQGDAQAQYNLGLCYVTGDGVEKDEREAVKWFLLAAGQGNADAQNHLGFCYDNGTGVEKDAREAVKWYRLAAEQGNAVAQSNLGVSYQDGTGVDKDEREAVKWYRLAAGQGNAQAQYCLGSCYDNGIGVEHDAAEAVKWYRLAAEQGNETARNRLRELGLGE